MFSIRQLKWSCYNQTHIATTFAAKLDNVNKCILGVPVYLFQWIISAISNEETFKILWSLIRSRNLLLRKTKMEIRFRIAPCIFLQFLISTPDYLFVLYIWFHGENDNWNFKLKELNIKVEKETFLFIIVINKKPSS